MDNLRNLANYLRRAFQRREKILSTGAIEKEYLPSLVVVCLKYYNIMLTMHAVFIIVTITGGTMS